MHAFDRQTDKPTDRNLIVRPRLHSMQRGKNPKYFCPPNRMWSKLSPLFYGKISLTSNISKTVRDTMLDSKKVSYETIHGLSIGTITFDLG